MTYQRLKRSKLEKFTEGFLEKAVDAVLVAIFFNLEFPSHARSKRWRLEEKISEDLEMVNYQAIKRAVVYLKKKGFVQSAKEALILPSITAEGKRRINSLLPQYDKKRIWDGRLYLITYDLPVKRNKERNYLRDFLKKIGCGMLQKSVWITPYNPTTLLQEFIKEKDLTDLVMVSSLGKEGPIGEMELPELIERVYHLDEINSRYREYLLDYKEKKLTKSQLVFRYLSILEDNPQLPFELLPKSWLGEEAYRVFRQLSGNGD